MAADLKMAPSSIHRLLAALVEEGLVEQHRGSGALLDRPEMIRLCHQATGRLPLSKIAMPHLRELVAVIERDGAARRCTTSSRQEMMFVAVAESNQPLRYVNKMWEWMPVYAGASGLAIMAFLPEVESAGDHRPHASSPRSPTARSPSATSSSTSSS